MRSSDLTGPELAALRAGKGSVARRSSPGRSPRQQDKRDQANATPAAGNRWQCNVCRTSFAAWSPAERHARLSRHYRIEFDLGAGHG